MLIVFSVSGKGGQSVFLIEPFFFPSKSDLDSVSASLIVHVKKYLMKKLQILLHIWLDKLTIRYKTQWQVWQWDEQACLITSASLLPFPLLSKFFLCPCFLLCCVFPVCTAANWATVHFSDKSHHPPCFTNILLSYCLLFSLFSSFRWFSCSHNCVTFPFPRNHIILLVSQTPATAVRLWNIHREGESRFNIHIDELHIQRPSTRF